jgi:hypothetical protein
LTAGGVITNGQSGSSTGLIGGHHGGIDIEGGIGSVTEASHHEPGLTWKLPTQPHRMRQR